MASCGLGEGEVSATRWLEAGCGCAGGSSEDGGVCECPDGESFNRFGVCSSLGPALAAEVRKDSPSVAEVVRLLDAGARADETDGNEDAVLAVAVTLGHAEVVSVLITAGANAEVRFGSGWGVAHYLSANPDGLEWTRAARVLLWFGEAVSLSSSEYDWGRGDAGGRWRWMFWMSRIGWRTRRIIWRWRRWGRICAVGGCPARRFIRRFAGRRGQVAWGGMRRIAGFVRGVRCGGRTGVRAWRRAGWAGCLRRRCFMLKRLANALRGLKLMGSGVGGLGLTRR